MKLNIKNKYNKIYQKLSVAGTPSLKNWELVNSDESLLGRIENYYVSKIDKNYKMIIDLGIEEEGGEPRVLSITFKHKNKMHRENGPARIWYNPDGSVEIEKWYRRGEPHRKGGPAIVYYYPSGEIDYTFTEWWQDGIRLNEDGTPYTDDEDEYWMDEDEYWMDDDE
jgi:hypothetical protein